MTKSNYITKIGKVKLEDELADLLAARADITERIAEARSYGDLSENAEYAAARDEQSSNEARIAEIEKILSDVKIIRETKKGIIGFGSTVVLKNGGTEEYKIVGAVEADPLDGKISNESPLGKELMGKKVGDKATIKTPKGEVTYTVKSIE